MGGREIKRAIITELLSDPTHHVRADLCLPRRRWRLLLLHPTSSWPQIEWAHINMEVVAIVCQVSALLLPVTILAHAMPTAFHCPAAWHAWCQRRPLQK